MESCLPEYLRNASIEETKRRTENTPPPASPFRPVRNLDFLFTEPSADYHAQSGKFLSSHLLAAFRRCPLEYHQKVTGVIQDKDRPAYKVGRAAHTLILEGMGTFKNEYDTVGPINPKTGAPYGRQTNAYKAYAEESDKDILNPADVELIEAMAMSVLNHPRAIQLLEKGQAEGVARANYRGADCQVRPDWFAPEFGIVDLKTCDDLTWFVSDAKRYQYAHQLAFYRAVLCRLEEVACLLPVYMIAVEKKAPYRCGVWLMRPDVLGIAQRENEAAIERLLACQTTGLWPTGYEDMREFSTVA